LKQETAFASDHNHVKMQVTNLPFSDIPGQSRLFLEYLDNPSAVSEFYPDLALFRADPRAYAGRVLDHYEMDRARLCDVLMEINSGGGSSVVSSIDALRRPDTVAIVTGQQAGLFTGPLYTIYKAISAVKFAAELTASGITAVPVFWAATEDHDMDEVATTRFVDREDLIREIEYRPSTYVNEAPVGSAVLDRSIDDVVRVMFSQLPNTDFSRGLRELVAEAYRDGIGYGAAFTAMMSRLFPDYGMVMIDPMHAEVKRLAAPAYLRAVERSDDMVAAIRKRTAKLESRGFHAQVLVEEGQFPLFWHDEDGRRRALRQAGHDTFRARYDRREFTRDQLSAIAATDPEKLSPNVMLRAVVQDHLLPTLCYFGGAGEVAYFAQNSAAYETLGRPVTPVIHRQSFTIIEPRHSRAMAKMNLAFRDLFDGKEAVSLKLGQDLNGGENPRTFAEVEEVVNTQLNRLDQLLSTEDPTLAANLATRRRKIIYHIAALRRKALLSAVRRDETAERRLDSLFANLLPDGALQERSLNVLVYLNKFGPGFIDWLYDAADLNDGGHRIIEL